MGESMRDDIPEWLGPPPPRETVAWRSWLARWQTYALEHLGDLEALNPDLDYGLLGPKERRARQIAGVIAEQLMGGLAGDELVLHLDAGDRDLAHAAAQAWLTGRAVFSHIPSQVAHRLDPWLERHSTPSRVAVARAIHEGLIAGVRGQACEPRAGVLPAAAYEAAWGIGNAKAIEADPR